MQGVKEIWPVVPITRKVCFLYKEHVHIGLNIKDLKIVTLNLLHMRQDSNKSVSTYSGHSSIRAGTLSNGNMDWLDGSHFLPHLVGRRVCMRHLNGVEMAPVYAPRVEGKPAVFVWWIEKCFCEIQGPAIHVNIKTMLIKCNPSWKKDFHPWQCPLSADKFSLATLQKGKRVQERFSKTQVEVCGVDWAYNFSKLQSSSASVGCASLIFLILFRQLKL